MVIAFWQFQQPLNKIYFLICNSCYWCASYFGINDLESSSQILGCHVCNSHDTELIPVSTNESFRINYNVTRVWKWNFIEAMTLSIKNQLLMSNIKYQYILDSAAIYLTKNDYCIDMSRINDTNR